MALTNTCRLDWLLSAGSSRGKKLGRYVPLLQTQHLLALDPCRLFPDSRLLDQILNGSTD